jgi:hypothetical protein
MPPDDPSERSWGEYRRFVVEELRRLGDRLDNVVEKIERFRQDDIAQIRTDIALLKFQAAMWGAGAGILFSGLITLIVKFTKVV